MGRRYNIKDFLMDRAVISVHEKSEFSNTKYSNSRYVLKDKIKILQTKNDFLYVPEEDKKIPLEELIESDLGNINPRIIQAIFHTAIIEEDKTRNRLKSHTKKIIQKYAPLLTGASPKAREIFQSIYALREIKDYDDFFEQMHKIAEQIRQSTIEELEMPSPFVDEKTGQMYFSGFIQEKV
jgi:hypothetical protein